MSEPREDSLAQVQETADDAITCKLSAVEQGYLDDEFISLLVPKGKRRSPLINRGYFARTAAVEEVATAFLRAAAGGGRGGRVQIVSLGAGLDTTFFKLKAANPDVPLLYVEVDFPRVCKRKISAILKSERLMGLIQGPAGSSDAVHSVLSPGVAELRSPGYVILNADLRDVKCLESKLMGTGGLDVSVPTLFLSECVLVYLEPEESGAVIAWAGATFPSAAFLTYEQIHPHDAFGQVMIKHLESRGCPLRGLLAFPDIPSQVSRYTSLGWQACSVVDMNYVYDRFLPRARIIRAEKAEIFDEFEEWHLMSGHYCLALAVNDRAVAPEGAPTEPTLMSLLWPTA